MAEMTKKLHFLKNGTEQTAKAYSTTAEAGSSYITNVIDNTTCYIPIGSNSDSRATAGRVSKNGTTYAIFSTGKPVYTEKSYTTPGTYTFTVPKGITRIRVAVCGGGGGAATTADDDNDSHDYSGGRGGTSSFGNISATGGYGGRAHLIYGGESGFSAMGSGGSGGSPNGKSGGSYNKVGSGNGTAVGGDGFALGFNASSGNYGKGSSVGSSGNSSDAIASGGGGSGGYITAYVDTTVGTTYSITVGALGSNVCSYWEGNSYSWTNGSPGFVLIAYGGDI